MSAAKDTFEANVWEASTFAAGAWRGVGVGVGDVGPFIVIHRHVHLAGSKQQHVHRAADTEKHVHLAGAEIKHA
ncbi:MAG: hypothetical protein ACYTEX_25690, partial [Planctomycetota bacterium]